MRTTRARNKIRASLKREQREDAEHRGREQLQEGLRKNGLPPQRIAGSPLLADLTREMGFRKADDFYIALGQGKISVKTVVNKVMQRLKAGEAVAGDETESRLPGVLEGRDERQRRTQDASSYGIKVEGVDDVVVRLAKCCRPVPGDEIVGYVSLGRGITIHREDCRNVEALMKAPERFTDVAWAGDNATSYRVELQVDAWDRTRLLEDLSRTFSEAGVNILEARCIDQAPDGQEPLRGRGRRHEQLEAVRRRACATSTRSSTPTGSRRPRDRRCRPGEELRRAADRGADRGGGLAQVRGTLVLSAGPEETAQAVLSIPGDEVHVEVGNALRDDVVGRNEGTLGAHRVSHRPGDQASVGEERGDQVVGHVPDRLEVLARHQ